MFSACSANTHASFMFFLLLMNLVSIFPSLLKFS